MQTTALLFLIKQLDPRTLKRRLKQLAIALGVLAYVITRAVALADRARASQRRSHARREAQALERLRERQGAWRGEVAPLERAALE